MAPPPLPPKKHCLGTYCNGGRASEATTAGRTQTTQDIAHARKRRSERRERERERREDKKARIEDCNPPKPPRPNSPAPLPSSCLCLLLFFDTHLSSSDTYLFVFPFFFFLLLLPLCLSLSLSLSRAFIQVGSYNNSVPPSGGRSVGDRLCRQWPRDSLLSHRRTTVLDVAAGLQEASKQGAGFGGRNHHSSLLLLHLLRLL